MHRVCVIDRRDQCFPDFLGVRFEFIRVRVITVGAFDDGSILDRTHDRFEIDCFEYFENVPDRCTWLKT